MIYADAHCHLADPRFDATRTEAIARAQAAGIGYFLQGGVDPSDWARQKALADHRWGLCFGLHPWFVNNATDAECDRALAQLATDLPDATALGELGLDKGPRMQPLHFARQQRIMRAQLALAQTHDKPLVLHVVRAHGPTLQILRETGGPWRGIVHGFTGAKEVAQDYIRQGLAVSVGGAVLGGGAKKLKAALPYIPKEHLCVESDAPDGRANSAAGTYNVPDALLEIAAAVGRLTQRSAHEVLTQSRDNLRRIFDLEIAL